jgi:hypothetical protein
MAAAARKEGERRAFKITGIVEAFFGQLWTMDERKSLIGRFVPKGLNHYLYAAKEDPKVPLVRHPSPFHL